MTTRRQKYKLNHSIKFIIKKDFEIEIFSSYPKLDLFWFDYVEAVVHYKGIEYIVYWNNIFEWVFLQLDTALHDVLKPYGELHPSITRDIGYFANIDRNTMVEGSPEIVCEIFRGIDQWVGQKYQIWCNGANSFWLYRKKDSFYFEMSPLIPYEDTTPAKFKKFMSTYKPFFIEEVPLETIQRLQAWIDEIQAILEANRERYEPLVTPKDNGIFITVSDDQMPKD